MSKKRTKQRTNLVQTQDDSDDTHINENGMRQPNPPRVNILKTVNHINANRGKFNEFYATFQQNEGQQSGPMEAYPMYSRY